MASHLNENFALNLHSGTTCVRVLQLEKHLCFEEGAPAVIAHRVLIQRVGFMASTRPMEETLCVCVGGGGQRSECVAKGDQTGKESRSLNAWATRFRDLPMRLTMVHDRKREDQTRIIPSSWQSSASPSLLAIQRQE